MSHGHHLDNRELVTEQRLVTYISASIYRDLKLFTTSMVVGLSDRKREKKRYDNRPCNRKAQTVVVRTAESMEQTNVSLMSTLKMSPELMRSDLQERLTDPPYLWGRSGHLFANGVASCSQLANFPGTRPAVMLWRAFHISALLHVLVALGSSSQGRARPKLSIHTVRSTQQQ